jgi:galactokinase
MIKATAPGSFSLAGEFTDQQNGSVLACTTRERARCTLNTDVKDTVISVPGASGLNIAQAVLTALEVLPDRVAPFHLTAETEIPEHAGLADRTALLATITGCVLAHLELRLNLYELAELIHKIESDSHGISCGFQNHYMAVFGGLNFLDFRGKDMEMPQGAMMPYATIEPLEKYVTDLPLVLAHRVGPTSFTPSVDKVNGQENARLAPLAKRALLDHDWDALADLMNRSHALRRNAGMIGEANEALIAPARAGGAMGAQLTSSTDGVTIVALTHDPDSTSASLQSLGAQILLPPHPCPGLTVAVEVTVP